MKWMATTAFNEAVDWYAGGEEDRAKHWAEMAINMAHHCGDKGRLEAVLRDKCLSLKLVT